MRSDEWLVITQFLIAQERSNYPRINDTFGKNRDMSLLSDAPYKEWSVMFRPQNLAFFVLPLENAFAFKWWGMLAVLLLSIYCLALRFLPKRYLIASLIAVVGAFAPFIFWWYQTITVMSIAWGIIIFLLALRIIDDKPLTFIQSTKKQLISNIILCSALVYSLTSFALLLYPAFQVPIVITVALAFIGYTLNARQEHTTAKKRKTLYKSVGLILLSGVVALGIVATFLLTRLDAVKAISNTSYPGARFVASGSPSQADVIGLMGFSQYRLTDSASIAHISPDKGSINQSELSAFLVTPFAFVIPIILIVIATRQQKKRIDWLGVSLILTSAIFAAHLFIPGFSAVFKLLGLYLVPLTRLQIGIGIAGILSMIYTIARISNLTQATRRLLYLYTGLLIAFYVACVFSVTQFDHTFAGDLRILFLAAFSLGGGISLLFYKNKQFLGLGILALLALLSTLTAQPLYRGLGSGYNNNIVTQKISQLSSQDSVWGLSGMIILENFPQMAGMASISGVNSYPNINFWSSVSDDTLVYNRYAHVLLSDTIKKEVVLNQPDVFTARIACNNTIGRTVTHVLATTPLQLPCYREIDRVQVAGGIIIFYKRNY